MGQGDLKRIGAALGAAAGMNDLAAKASMAAQAPAPPPPAVFDWHAEYAYSLAIQAFAYGFPYVYNALTRYKWTNIAQDPKHVPYSAGNQFWHAQEVLDATYRDGGCPNNDTAYSMFAGVVSRGLAYICRAGFWHCHGARECNLNCARHFS